MLGSGYIVPLDEAPPPPNRTPRETGMNVELALSVKT
jgi:hypothetical protein